MFKLIVNALLSGLLLALLFIALRDLSAPPSRQDYSHSVHDNDLRHSSYRGAVQFATPSVIGIRTAIAARNDDEKMSVGLGSGVVLSDDGYIVTNHHVIRDAEAIAVELVDGRTQRARLIGSDPSTDLAVIKVDGQVFQALPIAPQAARVGDIVLAIGYPFLLGQTVTQGIISATERLERGFIRLVQTDAAINKGNSGGALINTSGELVGINSEVLPSQLGVQGIGFAIPADFMQSIAMQIIQHGRVVRGSLGFSGTGNPGSVRDPSAPWQTRAVRVDAIDEHGAAAHSGLQIGDFITHFNGSEINGVTDLLQRVAQTKPGDNVRVQVMRLQESLIVDLVATEREQ